MSEPEDPFEALDLSPNVEQGPPSPPSSPSPPTPPPKPAEQEVICTHNQMLTTSTGASGNKWSVQRVRTNGGRRPISMFCMSPTKPHYVMTPLTHTMMVADSLRVSRCSQAELLDLMNSVGNSAVCEIYYTGISM